MRSGRPPRRRTKHYVSEWSSPALHAVAHRFARMRAQEDLSEHQEWLWDAIIEELEFRHRTTKPTWRRCTCAYCVGPFPF